MPEPIFDDPVVAEIHAIRAKMLADCDGDIEELMRQVAARQRACGHLVITTPFRKRVEHGPAQETAVGSVSSGESSPPAR